MKKYVLLLLAMFLFILSPVRAETNTSGTQSNEASTQSVIEIEDAQETNKDEYTGYATDDSSNSGNRFFLDPERDKDFTLMVIVITIVAILLHIASFVVPIIFVTELIKRIRKASKDGMAAQPSGLGTDINEVLTKSDSLKDDSSISSEETSHFDSPFE